MTSILHSILRVALSIAISVTLAWPAAAQILSDTKTPSGWKQQALLGDRLRIFVPTETAPEGRSYANIMGTAIPATSMTRVRIPINGTEIVVQAKDRKALAPKDVPSAINSTRYLAQFGGQREELTLDLGGGWTAFAIIPREYKYWSDSYLLAYCWITDPDGLLYEMVLASWIDDKAYSTLAQTAIAIVRSLKPGLYFQEVPNGTTSLDSQIALQNDAIELVIDLDGHYYVERETGLSFVVHRISQLVEIGSDGGEMGIYLGRYPSFNPAAELERGGKAIPDQAQILGQTPTWIVYDSDRLRKQSTLLNVLPGTTALKCHLFILGTPEQVKSLVDISHSLRTSRSRDR